MERNQIETVFMVDGKPVRIAYENGKVKEVAYSGMKAERKAEGKFSYC